MKPRRFACWLRRSVLLMILLGLATSGCLREVLSVGAEAELWMPQLEVGASTDRLSLVDLNLETDIDRDEDLIGSYKTWVEILGYRILLDSFRTTVGGQNPVKNSFNFDGIAFAPGDVATSDLDFTLNRFNFEIGVPEPIPGLGIYFIIGIDALDIDLTIVKDSTGEIGNMVEHIPLVTLGLRVAAKLKRIEAFARVQAVQSEWVAGLADFLENIDDLQGFYFDGEAGFRIWWGDDHYAITAGYRFYDMDLEFQTGESIDLLLQGPFISIQGKLP